VAGGWPDLSRGAEDLEERRLGLLSHEGEKRESEDFGFSDQVLLFDTVPDQFWTAGSR